MPKDSDATQAELYEEEGRRQAFSLDDCAFVLALGDKPLFAAYVALGMARVQSLRRPVYVVDCVGLIPAIDDLVPFEFRRGITSVITEGRPLNDVAVKLEEKGQLYILPSGAAKLNHADLMANERWMQVTEELRQKDALMIVVVPADEPAVLFLVPEAYGSVLVGRVRSPTGVTALASISAPVASSPVATVARSTTSIAAAPADGAGSKRRSTSKTSANDLGALLAAAEQAAARPHAVRRVVGLYAQGDEPRKPQRTRVWIVGLCLVLLGLELAVWYSRRNRPPEQEEPPPVTSQQVVPVPAPPPAPPPAPEATPEAAQPTTTPP